MNITIKDFMSLALEEAQKAEERGEVPIGAVIADPQKKKCGGVCWKSHKRKK